MRLRAFLLLVFLVVVVLADASKASSPGSAPPPTELARLGAMPMTAYTTDFTFATPGQAHNITLAAERLRGQVIQPGKTFSYNGTVGPRTPETGFRTGRIFVGNRIVKGCGGGVCQVATTLYNVILLADLPVVERHQHSLTVPYVPPGQDATVSWGNVDFRFRNNLKGPLLLWSSIDGRQLHLSLYGPTVPPKVTVHHRTLATYPFTTETNINDSLAPGTEKVIAPGQPGVKVESWVNIQDVQGSRDRPLGIDSYRPSPRIVEIGPPVAPQA